MKTVLQVLFGLLLGSSGVVVCFNLGLVVRGGSPDWQTAMVLLLLVAGTQWVAFFAFRRGIALQVLVGVVLCLVIAYGLVFSTLPMFWEHEEAAQRGVYTITWRSDLMFLLLLAVGQGISFLIFRWMRSARGIAHPSRS